MGALLDRQGAVRERRLDLEGRGLDPRLLRVGGVVDLGGVVVPLGPAQVHPQQHGGEVGRVDAAGLGADGDQGLALVVLPRQQGAHLERLDGLLQRRQLASRPRPGLAASASSWPSSTSMARSSSRERRLTTRSTSACSDRQPGGHPLGVVRVVPEVGRGDRLLQLGDLGPLALGVDDGLDRAQRLVEVAQRGRKVGPATTGHSTDPASAPDASVALVGGELLDPDEPVLTARAGAPASPAPRSRRRRPASRPGRRPAPSTKSQTATRPTTSSPATTSALRGVEPAVPSPRRRVRHPGHHGQQRDHPGEHRQTTVEGAGDQPDHGHQADQPGQRAEGQGEVLVQHRGHGSPHSAEAGRRAPRFRPPWWRGSRIPRSVRRSSARPNGEASRWRRTAARASVGSPGAGP